MFETGRWMKCTQLWHWFWAMLWWQLADFRFAEQMSDEQSFSICGMADFLAPEIIKGQGHGLASDWCLHISSAILLMRESSTGIGMNQQLSRLNVKVQLRLFNCLQHCPWFVVCLQLHAGGQLGYLCTSCYKMSSHLGLGRTVSLIHLGE